jgi:hypothetical protein
MIRQSVSSRDKQCLNDQYIYVNRLWTRLQPINMLL